MTLDHRLAFNDSLLDHSMSPIPFINEPTSCLSHIQFAIFTKAILYVNVLYTAVADIYCRILYVIVVDERDTHTQLHTI